MLKKGFASFFCVLLIFSVSVLPCFGSDLTGEDSTVNTDGTLCTVYLSTYILGNVGDFSVPVNTLQILNTGHVTNGVALPITPVLTNLSSFILQEDVTLYWRVVPFLFDDEGIVYIDMATSSNLPSLPSFWYGGGNGGMNESETYQSTVQRLGLGNDSYGGQLSRSYRATLPAETPTGAKVENFEINYPGSVNNANALWTTKNSNGDSLFFHIDLFQVVRTTDTAILGKLDTIISKLDAMNVNINNVLTACNNILNTCIDIEADTDTIVSLLGVVEDKLADIDDKLASVDTNVEAIYYLLSEALSDEADAVTGMANSVITDIQANASAETYYQTSMQNTYNQLDIGGWQFGEVLGSLNLVVAIFDDIWDTFGYWSIVFTFPLMMGIALLVIGRLSRYGGGNSSRTKEHKGGEGGA